MPALRYLAVSTILVLFVGMAACLVCEFDQCGQTESHNDDCQCRCACALSALPGVTVTGVALNEPAASDVVVLPGRVVSLHPPSLFRPPRF